MTCIGATFRQLHSDTSPLILPNAWDAGSARLFEKLGASAIATSSAGVAWSLGYGDGRSLPFAELLAVTARMSKILTVPLSIDVENGYSDNPEVVADNIVRLVDLGIAGINIEDGSDKPTLLASKIEAIKNAVSKLGIDLFVNARSDVYLANLIKDSKFIEESITRGKLYTRAGADGLFLPGIKQTADIMAVARDVLLPLNVLAWPGLISAFGLSKLGVRRLSAGSSISQALWSKAEKLAKGF
jgi:2-methylisocitrate lyase-like PEP mutase family enzyme